MNSLFDQSKLIVSIYIYLYVDPCRNPAVKSHPFLGRCRYFWKCNRGRSEFEFCGQNYRYDGIADTCVPDFQCKDEDPPNDALIQESPPESKFLPNVSLL